MSHCWWRDGARLRFTPSHSKHTGWKYMTSEWVQPGRQRERNHQLHRKRRSGDGNGLNCKQTWKSKLTVHCQHQTSRQKLQPHENTRVLRHGCGGCGLFGVLGGRWRTAGFGASLLPRLELVVRLFGPRQQPWRGSTCACDLSQSRCGI